MGRIKYAEIIVMASKEHDPKFVLKPDQAAFLDVLADNTEEHYHWYHDAYSFIEDLTQYKDLNAWYYRILQIPQMVLDYLTGININTNDEEE